MIQTKKYNSKLKEPRLFWQLQIPAIYHSMRTGQTSPSDFACFLVLGRGRGWFNRSTPAEILVVLMVQMPDTSRSWSSVGEASKRANLRFICCEEGHWPKKRVNRPPERFHHHAEKQKNRQRSGGMVRSRRRGCGSRVLKWAHLTHLTVPSSGCWLCKV